MVDPSPFLLHASAKVKAEQIAKVLLPDWQAREAVLLQMAYRKRIRPVPQDVALKSIGEFMQMATAARVEFESDRERELVYDRLGKLCWDTLADDEAQREWLMRVK